MSDLPVLEIKTSRKRLIGMALFGLACALGGALNLLPALNMGSNGWPWIIGGLCLGLLVWSALAAFVALRLPPLAYRLTPEGLFYDSAQAPVFTWDQVRGATLVRGKRRSAVAVILDAADHLTSPDILPGWQATALARPVERDVTLTNVDTNLSLEMFLDLIAPYLHTYGQASLTEEGA